MESISSHSASPAHPGPSTSSIAGSYPSSTANPTPTLLADPRYVITSPLSPVSWGANRLDIFGLGTEGGMYHKAWDGANWGPSQDGWDPLGGVFNSPPAVVSWSSNRLDVFGLGTDNQAYHLAWNGTDWDPLAAGKRSAETSLRNLRRCPGARTASM